MNSSVDAPRVALLGVGSMGGAILAGLRSPGTPVARPIAVTTRSAESAAAFAGANDVSVVASSEHPEANREAAAAADIVILAVKPWMIHDLLREIAPSLRPGTIVVSVAAGVTCDSMQALVDASVVIVRAMPNTPSHLGLGVTGIAAGATANEADLEQVRRLFTTVGSVLVVREDQINAIAAVSGSGPAYLFYYVEEMTAAAVRLGFTVEQAKLLAEETVIGAAQLMRHSDESPEQLRRNVTSPKGTTEQAILELQGADLGSIFDRALAANIRRSRELEAGQ